MNNAQLRGKLLATFIKDEINNRWTRPVIIYTLSR